MTIYKNEVYLQKRDINNGNLQKYSLITQRHKNTGQIFDMWEIEKNKPLPNFVQICCSIHYNKTYFSLSNIKSSSNLQQTCFAIFYQQQQKNNKTFTWFYMN